MLQSNSNDFMKMDFPVIDLDESVELVQDNKEPYQNPLPTAFQLQPNLPSLKNLGLCQDDAMDEANGVNQSFRLFDMDDDKIPGFDYHDLTDSLSDFVSAELSHHTTEKAEIQKVEQESSIHGVNTNTSRCGNDEKSLSNLNIVQEETIVTPKQKSVASDAENIQTPAEDMLEHYIEKPAPYKASPNQSLNKNPEPEVNVNLVEGTAKTSHPLIPKVFKVKKCPKRVVVKGEDGNDEVLNIPFIKGRKRAFKKRSKRTMLNSAGLSSSKEEMDLSQRRDVLNKTILRAMRRFITNDFRKYFKKFHRRNIKNQEIEYSDCEKYARQIIPYSLEGHHLLKFYIMSVIDHNLVTEARLEEIGLPRSEITRFYDTIYKYSNTKVVSLLNCKALGELFDYFRAAAKANKLENEKTISKNKQLYDQVMDEFSSIFKGVTPVDQIII